jgi:D-3-phosphoglycerate dehydrogenase
VSSVRGIVVDGTPVVSRIEEFNHLYAALTGNTIVLRYADRPGVVAAIGQALSLAGINIENIIAPNDYKSGDSLAVIKTNLPISEDQLQAIAKTISAKLAFAISM